MNDTISTLNVSPVSALPEMKFRYELEFLENGLCRIRDTDGGAFVDLHSANSRRSEEDYWYGHCVGTEARCRKWLAARTVAGAEHAAKEKHLFTCRRARRWKRIINWLRWI